LLYQQHSKKCLDSGSRLFNLSQVAERWQNFYSEKLFHIAVEKCTNCIPEFAERSNGGKVLRESLVVLSGGRGGNKDNTTG